MNQSWAMEWSWEHDPQQETQLRVTQYGDITWMITVIDEGERVFCTVQDSAVKALDALAVWCQVQSNHPETLRLSQMPGGVWAELYEITEQKWRWLEVH